MKKKRFSVLILSCALLCVTGVGCNKVTAAVPSFSFDGCSGEEEHEHTYAHQWSYDENEHWNETACEQSSLHGPLIVTEPHTFKNGVCTVCGYRQPD